MAKKKTHASAEAVVAGKKRKEKKDNPFESRKVESKFKVMGRRLKGQELKLGEARSKAFEKRKETLGVEYKQRDKKNAFVDRRFGEGDQNMTAEEKMLVRFQKETKKRIGKKSMYNLEGSSEDEGFTHMGQSLDKVDMRKKFEDSASDGEMDADMVESVSFGGGLFKQTKTKKDIMNEVIAKSKMYKKQRQDDKEAQMELTEKLDADFDTVKALLADKMRPTMTREEKRKERAKEREAGLSSYDAMLRDLASDARAKATDRLKTDEEIAREAKERLEQLERERIKRMAGEGSSASGSASDDGEAVLAKEDDAEDEEEGEGEGESSDDENEELDAEDMGGDASDLDSDEGPVAGKRRRGVECGSGGEPKKKRPRVTFADQDSEGEGEGDDGEGELGEGESDEELQVLMMGEEGPSKAERKAAFKEELRKKRQARRELAEKRRKAPKKLTEEERAAVMNAAEINVPFTFTMPRDLDALQSLLDSFNPELHALVLERLRACHHLSLGGDNKKKLQTLFTLLVERFLVLCSTRPFVLAPVDVLVPHIFAMAQDLHDHAAREGRALVQRLQADVRSKLEVKSESAWPTFGDLMSFRLLSLIFPAEDFRHNVTTPCQLLMAECLSHSPVTDLRAATAGLYLCNLLLQFIGPARRFAAEPLAFLATMIAALSPDNASSNVKTSKNGKKKVAKKADMKMAEASGAPLLKWGEDVTFLRLAVNDKTRTLECVPLDFIGVLASKSKPTNDNNLKLSLLRTSISVLQRYAAVYSEYQPFPELFAWVPPMLNRLPLDCLPQSLEEACTSLRSAVEARSSTVLKLRKPLAMHTRRAVAIRTYEPLFQENYSMTKDYDPDTVRAEARKLKKQIKHEEKGAARELRKDAVFLERARLEEKRRDDEERAAAVNRVMGMLQTEEAEKKQLERMRVIAEKRKNQSKGGKAGKKK